MKLFEPIVPADRLHGNFKVLLDPQNRYVCDVLNDWARGFVDRDGKFVEEFQTTFNSSFWELYVHAVLRKLGLTIDFSLARPDFCLRDIGFNVEAAVALHAQGATPEHDQVALTPPADLNEFNRAAILRLSNTIGAKHKKYLHSYGALEHVRAKPFVIAVASFDQPFSYLSAQRPIEAVLFRRYVDEEQFASAGYEGQIVEQELPSVPKNAATEIELGLFCSSAYKEVSAVIFSACGSFGKARAMASDPDGWNVFTALRLNTRSVIPHVIREPHATYSEGLLDGLRVYHNPYAEYPLDPAIFRNKAVFQIYFEDGEARVEQHEGLLLCRFVFTLRKAPTISRQAGDSNVDLPQ